MRWVTWADGRKTPDPASWTEYDYPTRLRSWNICGRSPDDPPRYIGPTRQMLLFDQKEYVVNPHWRA